MREYKHTADIINEEISLKGLRILDVGTGTGAWAASFLPYHPDFIQGMDLSEKMIKEAQSRHPNIEFIAGNIETAENIPTGSFDLVTASFVVHGVKQDKRKRILQEMFRISNQYVILQDFIGKTPAFIRFLEWMERSDYKHFKRNIIDELSLFSNSVKSLPVRSGAGLYICKK
jgi:ubiquinone/menaquinone biosynthesis C-methylase UbiE